MTTNMSTSPGHVRIGLALALTSACTSEVPQTQVLVQVTADPRVVTSVTYVRAFLYAPDATDESKWAQDLHFPIKAADLGRDGVTFPFSFGIAQGAEERFKLVIKGYASSDPSAPPVIEQKALTGFVPNQKLGVTLSLLDACYQKADQCGGLATTCTRGTAEEAACGPVPVLGLMGEPVAQPSDAGPTRSSDASMLTPTTAPDATGQGPDKPPEAEIPQDHADAARSDGGMSTRPTVARLQNLCDMGDLGACVDLGLIYDFGDQGVAQDQVRAVALYTKACDGDFARGCANLGLSYYNGEGVPQDRARAAKLLMKACDGGSARGCTNLGTMYQAGRGGLILDLPRAFELYTRACNLEATSCSNLAYFYKHGVVVPSDLARAAQLETQACNGGAMAGCNNLGLLHLFGEGVPRDRARAEQLFVQACDGGEPLGCQNLSTYGFR